MQCGRSPDRPQSVSGDTGRPRFEDRMSTGLKILSLDVVGVSNVVPEHVLSAVTSKVGESMNEARLGKDADAIFELGFFAKLNPCGFDASVMTSVEKEMSESYKKTWSLTSEKLFDHVKRRLVENLVLILTPTAETTGELNEKGC